MSCEFHRGLAAFMKRPHFGIAIFEVRLSPAFSEKVGICHPHARNSPASVRGCGNRSERY